MAKSKKTKKPETATADADREGAQGLGATPVAPDAEAALESADADTAENALPLEEPTLVEPLEQEQALIEDPNVIDLAQAREQAAAETPFALTPDGDGEAEAKDGESEGLVPFEQLEPLIESLLFAADKPLSLADLKRLTGERDTRLLEQGLVNLERKRAESGVQVVGVAGGWSLRTNPAFSQWVGKLLAGRPVRLSRAMLETLSIIAYRQPITRPEIDEIRGVDCGPVLKTLLDRGLIRIIGKKEEVGRPMLYGTTSEFLRVFSLKDLTELPTLRQFHELSAEHQAKVAEAHGEAPSPEPASPAGGLEPLAPAAFAGETSEDDTLLEDLEEASAAASRAAGPLAPEPEPPAEGALSAGSEEPPER